MALRRGRCPGVRELMATGDGLLARIHPPQGRLSVVQAEGVAAAATACGNGQIDVTGRGNLQLRGIRDALRGELAARMEELGLLEPPGPGPHRLTIVSPLAGIDPGELVDAAALAERIEAAGREIAGLPIKTAVAVDGGGLFALDGVQADIHVLAVPDGGAALALSTRSGPLWIGVADLAAVPQVVRNLLFALARLASIGAGEVRRVCDLSPDQRGELIAAAGRLGLVRPRLDRPSSPHAGAIALADQQPAFLAGLPFGRCGADQLAGMAALAARSGEGELRLSFTRGILVPLTRHTDLAACRDAVEGLGLIDQPDDPRLFVNACPGTPACASGFAPAAADAGRLAVAARALIAAGATLHLSGCAKGCARPGSADLTLVGQPGGGYGIVLAGTARDAPGLRLPVWALEARLAGMTGAGEFAAAFGARR